MSKIRFYIEYHLKDKGYKLQQFSEIADINVGTLSAIIKGTRLISMNQLDQITSAMDLAQGYFYEMYGVECFIESAPHWRRLEPFIYRCAELGKLESIRAVVSQVTDDHSYIDELFEVAEDLYKRGLKQAALILYECVSECEKYQHSERLAMCKYRIFLISMGYDQKENRRIISQFEPFIGRVDQDYQLDAIKDLANAYWGVHEWNKMFDLSQELERRADLSMKQRKKRVTKAQYPFFIYKAYANLLIANYYDYTKNYREALRYTDVYEKIIENQAKHFVDYEVIHKFREWAKFNKCLYNVMMGRKEVIPEYITYIEHSEEEILPAMVKILQSANRYQYDIDEVLIRFKAQIDAKFSDVRSQGRYTVQSWHCRRVVLFYELAFYYFNKKRFELGAVSLLISFELSIFVKDDVLISKCVNLYGQFKEYLSNQVHEKYNILIDDIYIEASL
ncbi:helix-turn-helix domain-containing protein [Paenibacillus xylanivorans]|uniref:helix-turn-helix domain-containing protein n=1 Tax=Paenibacillus xylanivorans TaxID=1705561 RepID=UPI0006B1A72E|nr:helix-turn-helix transcriptional regulator [Paenibacillus xylanivorans]